MTRRRRRSWLRLHTRLPGFALGAWLWLLAGMPLHMAGAFAFVLASLAVWPLFVLALLVTPGYLARSLVPVDWRRRWRHGRPGLRQSVPGWVRRIVLAADRRRCVHCGGRDDLQVDHFFPWSLGGINSFWNYLTLCGRCNRVKSNYWMYPSGAVVYRGFEGSSNRSLAAQILRSEQRARRDPARVLRAAWAL